MFLRSLTLKTADFPPVKGLIHTRLFRPLVTRFVAGEDLEEAMVQVEKLTAQGIMVTFDLLGENVSSVEESEAVVQNYLAMIDRIGKSQYKDRINVSIKPTHYGIDLGMDVVERNVRTILERASKDNMFIRIDMEDRNYTQRTVDLVKTVHKDFPNSGTVLQAMMKRTIDDVEDMIANGVRVRLVKGAYLEPASVAFQEKAKVDENYVEAAKRLMERGDYPAIATHDTRIIETLKTFANEKGIDKSKFEWQMLYGIRRDLQQSLVKEGYNLRVYVPYGTSWYPYFSRRLAERPANVLFVAKAMFHG